LLQGQPLPLLLLLLFLLLIRRLQLPQDSGLILCLDLLLKIKLVQWHCQRASAVLLEGPLFLQKVIELFFEAGAPEDEVCVGGDIDEDIYVVVLILLLGT
jgi:hypothetical protein